MAKFKLIGITGIRIEPEGAGYRVLGEFRATLPGAIRFAMNHEVPEEDEIESSRSAQVYEDECLDHRIERARDSKERGYLQLLPIGIMVEKEIIWLALAVMVVTICVVAMIAYWYGSTRENRERIKQWKAARKAYPSAGPAKRN